MDTGGLVSIPSLLKPEDKCHFLWEALLGFTAQVCLPVLPHPRGQQVHRAALWEGGIRGKGAVFLWGAHVSSLPGVHLALNSLLQFSSFH